MFISRSRFLLVLFLKLIIVRINFGVQLVEEDCTAQSNMSISDKIMLLGCEVLAYYYVRERDRKRKEEKRRNRKYRVWEKKWIARRAELGASSRLIRELAQEDPCSYRNIMRMNETDFKELLSLLNPRLQRKDTQFRSALLLI